MAIINITPDSFSGDGVAGDIGLAVEHARAFEAAGADILDIGGESSRPDANPVTPEEEAARVIPAVRAIASVSGLPISIDTYHASVAEAGIDAGAAMVNDISGLRFDPRMAATVAQARVPLIAMHNQRGRAFHDVISDIRAGFDHSLCLADEAGIPRERIIIDPGFGFGWREDHNVEMVRRLPELWSYDLPILLGTSRKSTLGAILGTPVSDRLEGSLATAAMGIAAGVDIIRVHDVRQAVRLAKVADAVARDNWRPGHS
ncbi:MAG: dihydropteroate synthase [Dehalococcoidia bacterium]|nr:dihydropteroate synthase [Dehalococcoidia bacterium]